MIYLDTHAAAWLYEGILERFPDTVRRILASEEELKVSPMSVLELQYLYEIGRASEPADAVIRYLRAQIGLQVCDKEFSAIIPLAITNDWTRDPFDRIIVAQAALDQATLITKDQLIRVNYPHALWK